jgi:hypothetical protein
MLEERYLFIMDINSRPKNNVCRTPSLLNVVLFINARPGTFLKQLHI